MISREVAEWLLCGEGKAYKKASRVETEKIPGANRLIIYGYQAKGFDKEVLIAVLDTRILSDIIKHVALSMEFEITESKDFVTLKDFKGETHKFNDTKNNFAFERIAAAAEKIVTLLQKP